MALSGLDLSCRREVFGHISACRCSSRARSPRRRSTILHADFLGPTSAWFGIATAFDSSSRISWGLYPTHKMALKMCDTNLQVRLRPELMGFTEEFLGPLSKPKFSPSPISLGSQEHLQVQENTIRRVWGNEWGLKAPQCTNEVADGHFLL